MGKKIGIGALVIVVGFAIYVLFIYDIFSWFRTGPVTVVKDDLQPVSKISSQNYKVETVVEGLQNPWALQFLPDGRIIVTEKNGAIRFVENGVLSAPVAGVPKIHAQQEGGLMDIELHPDFANNGWIYLAYAISDGKNNMTRIARYTLTPNGLTDELIIMPGAPANDNGRHFGSRLRFGPDGKLYVTLGEKGDTERAQDMQDLLGKTLRYNDDGSIPSDNPYIGKDLIRPEIFSYGHRNAQGMDFQPGTGLMFQTEHGPSGNDGPRGGDEVNIVEKGKNYGWPHVHHKETLEGTEAPLLEYTPAVAPAGAMFYTGDKFPEWANNFFFTNLRGECIIRVELDGRKVTGHEIMFKNEFGRLRDITTGPDGYIYFITSVTDPYGPGRAGGDRILRIVPAQENG